MNPAALITSTGLRRAAFHLDMMAAMNRFEFTKNPREVDALTDEQLCMMLIESKQPEGSPVWKLIEQRVGHTLSRKD